MWKDPGEPRDSLLHASCVSCFMFTCEQQTQDRTLLPERLNVSDWTDFSNVMFLKHSECHQEEDQCCCTLNLKI